MGTATITGSVVYPVASGGSNGTLLTGSPEIVSASSPLTLAFDEKFSNTFKIPTGGPTVISFGTIASGSLVYVGTDQPLSVILSAGAQTFTLAAGGFIFMHLAGITGLSVTATLVTATVEVLVLGANHLIIQPKLSSPSSLDHVEMIRTNSKRYIFVIFQDDAGNPVDVVEEYDNTNAPRGELDLQVTTIDGDILYSESYFPPSVSPELLRVSHPSTGKYQIHWGINDDETNLTGTVLFNWHLRKDTGEEDFYKTQIVEVTPPKVLAILPYLRLQIDKSLKVMNQEEYCNLGYSDSNLVAFLNLGLSYINGRQPYVGWTTLDAFPLDRGLNILLKCAVYDGLFAQLVFAIDTDIPTFSDQGHAFVITHATQIKSVRDSLAQELEKQVREFKMHYIHWGAVGVEMRLGWSWYQLLSSSPSGALFRNSFMGNS